MKYFASVSFARLARYDYKIGTTCPRFQKEKKKPSGWTRKSSNFILKFKYIPFVEQFNFFIFEIKIPISFNPPVHPTNHNIHFHSISHYQFHLNSIYNFNSIWIQFTFLLLNFINYFSFTTDPSCYFKLISFTNSLKVLTHFISHNSNWFSIFSFQYSVFNFSFYSFVRSQTHFNSLFRFITTYI